MDDDFLLDDDEEVLDEGDYYNTESEDSDPSGDDSGSSLSDDSTSSDSSKYNKLMTPNEIDFIAKYDEIVAAGKLNKEGYIEDAFTTIVSSNPAHTSASMVSYIVMDVFNKQGHNRINNSVYNPETRLTGRDVDIDFIQEDDSGLNEELTNAAREQITRFVEYLSSRDLSKDSTVAAKVKKRQLPAFIIYLFSSGLYEFILNCPTMPPEYDKQINNAFRKISEAKYEIVEDLAKRYEEAGRPKVADRVRKLQTYWFSREPAEIRTASEFSDLGLTQEDVSIYREYRSKFQNVSKSLTRDVTSDLIQVVIGPGQFATLKDKTAAQSIEDVKQLYRRWAAENPIDSDLANKIIWNDVDEFKNNV